MARTVYSFRIASGRLGAGIWPLGGPDATHLWVLRDLDAYANPTPPEAVDLLLRGDADQGLVFLGWGVGDHGSKQWQGRQVIPPGGHCSLQIGGAASVDFALSGYVLSFP